MPAINGRYWMATIRATDWNPMPDVNQLPEKVTWIKGQKEIGAQNGFEHWQVIIGMGHLNIKVREKCPACSC